MSNPKSPFVPGAKVALRSGRWGPSSWTLYEVEKRFKNGRFTLKGREGQWNEHPPNNYGYGEDRWHAYRAGQGRYADGTLLIWDNKSDALIQADLGDLARDQRLRKLQARFERLKYGDVTDDALNAIETALDHPAPAAQGE